MKKIILLSIIAGISVFFIFSKQTFAAAACQPPGTDNTSSYCDNLTRPCCTPIGGTLVGGKLVGGTPYTCNSTITRGGSKTSCIPQNSSGGNQTCLGKGATNCTDVGGGSSGTKCCTTDTDGKTPLACDTTQSPPTCIVNKGCVNTEGQPCGTDDKNGYLCCAGTNAKGETLQCLYNGQPDVHGTCTYQNVAITAPPAVPPPPPPCADTGAIGDKGCQSVDTAFGIWSTDPAGFVKNLFSVLLSVSGGIAMLIIIFAGYRMIMSQGDPEKIAGAREQITAAIIGLLFIIFSLVILEIIGVDILHIPGFGGTAGTTSGGGNGGGGGGGSADAADTAACKNISIDPLQCGLAANGTGAFCGQAGPSTNCQILGHVGTLYTCDKNGNMVTFSRCANNVCNQVNGANNPDACATPGPVQHYACSAGGLCQQSACTSGNNCFLTGNCNNSCH